jgi:hypothetical protein
MSPRASPAHGDMGASREASPLKCPRGRNLMCVIGFVEDSVLQSGFSDFADVVRDIVLSSSMSCY